MHEDQLDYAEEEKIIFTWTEEVIDDDTRCGVMYCFKSCSVNQN